jgi:hypothetical protein
MTFSCVAQNNKQEQRKEEKNKEFTNFIKTNLHMGSGKWIEGNKGKSITFGRKISY